MLSVYALSTKIFNKFFHLLFLRTLSNSLPQYLWCNECNVSSTNKSEKADTFHLCPDRISQG